MQFIGLGDGVVGAGDLALVAVKDGDFDIDGEAGAIQVGNVRVVKGGGETPRAVGLRQLVLALGGRHPQLGRQEVRPQLERQGLQVLLVAGKGA